MPRFPDSKVDIFVDNVESSEQILALLEKHCKSRMNSVIVHDVSSGEEARLAKELGIQKFPVIIIDGKKRIEGLPTLASLSELELI